KSCALSAGPLAVNSASARRNASLLRLRDRVESASQRFHCLTQPILELAMFPTPLVRRSVPRAGDEAELRNFPHSLQQLLSVAAPPSRPEGLVPVLPSPLPLMTAPCRVRR